MQKKIESNISKKAYKKGRGCISKFFDKLEPKI